MNPRTANRQGLFSGQMACCIVIGLALALVGLPARASDYEQSTRAAIQRLVLANELMAAGNVAESRAQLEQIGDAIGSLYALTQQYRERSNREHARCTDSIADLDVRTNQLYTEQKQLLQQIADLSASLEGAALRRDLAAAEVARLNAQLSATIRAVKDREARLQELEKWWWVPGYGQYLAIRTLVDDDIGQYNRMIGALNDQQQRLSSNQNTLAESRKLIATLSQEKQEIEHLHGQLNEMRMAAQGSLQRLNNMSVFLTDADVFWGMTQNLLKVDAASYVLKMKVIQAVLSRNSSSPSFSQPSVTLAQNFQQKLLEFSESIDKNSNMLLKDTTEFCGGPALTAQATVKPVERCNVNQITAYYEIVDPKTCSFRYLNPPGCPPEPKSVNADAQAVAQGLARGSWSRADEQNWVGRPSTSPCATSGTIYYGKLSGPEQCEAACMADAACTFWSFNRANGFMPNSTSQCWGGPASMDANKSAWGGFISGGIR